MFDKIAIQHMHGVTKVVTMLGLVLAEVGGKPLLAMLSTRDIAQAHPHKGGRIL
jgi:hypothetical protein